MKQTQEPEKIPIQTTATVSVALVERRTSNVPQDIVTVVAKYPKNWNKKKHLKDGKEYEVSRDTANNLVEAGIAKIVGENEPKEATAKVLAGEIINPNNETTTDALTAIYIEPGDQQETEEYKTTSKETAKKAAGKGK